MVNGQQKVYFSRGRHGFHVVSVSPWPVLTAVGAYILTLGLVIWFHGGSLFHVWIGLCTIGFMSSLWWRDVIRESTYGGNHTSVVVRSHAIGMALFIISESFFFLSIFWAFFHSSLAPSVEIGCCWPPVGVEPLDPWKVPLFNTVVLISSGVTVTWAHRALRSGSLDEVLVGLFATVCLGGYFTYLQLGEYKAASFTIADGVYGSTFFVGTGFHGLHVIVGTVFLSVCLWRAYMLHFSTGHHFGLEAAIWYWHFVDVVWVFLFIWMYVWGSWGVAWDVFERRWQ
uniref:Cytochrome c oxidase subunit 3 n=1 Tax=Myadora brevis TaxID=457650 RepID=A0A1U9XPJ7_9BIVA|nr:cytochrome c oxidase subunit III [Myadora brevis]AQZ26163.1 cytochrome c oxidase subunit III [Myadora brevis]